MPWAFTARVIAGPSTKWLWTWRISGWNARGSPRAARRVRTRHGYEGTSSESIVRGRPPPPFRLRVGASRRRGRNDGDVVAVVSEARGHASAGDRATVHRWTVRFGHRHDPHDLDIPPGVRRLHPRGQGLDALSRERRLFGTKRQREWPHTAEDQRVEPPEPVGRECQLWQASE